MGWQRFLDMVKSEIDKLKGGATVAEKNVPSSWAKDAWEWAKKEKLLDGTWPKDNLTREEFAVVLKRLADKK